MAELVTFYRIVVRTALRMVWSKTYSGTMEDGVERVKDQWATLKDGYSQSGLIIVEQEAGVVTCVVVAALDSVDVMPCNEAGVPYGDDEVYPPYPPE